MGDGMISDDKVRISVVVSKVIMRKLKKQANYEDRSVSNMVNKIIREYYGIKNEEE